MPAPNRFEIVAPLPSPRGHLHIAVDRGSSPPRAVVLALYPRTISDDPARLERLAGEMERAAQLFHPNVLAPEAMEAVGDDLAAVTGWRDAITLRELLDAGGALPHEIAARIAADVCAGLSHAHGRPQPVVHGLLRPEAVLLDESGSALVSGFGMPGGSGIADDVLGVGELLHECLVGEPPDDPTVPLGESEAPPSIAVVVNQARAPRPEERHPTAEVLGAAIARAVPLAAPEIVAAYVNAVLPARSGARAERRDKIEAALAGARSGPPDVSEEISDEDIVAADTALPVGAKTPEPDQAREPAATGNDPTAGEPPKPAPPETAASGSHVASTPSPEPSSPPAGSPATGSSASATAAAAAAIGISKATSPATSGSSSPATATQGPPLTTASTATSTSPVAPSATPAATPAAAATSTGTVASTESTTSIPTTAPATRNATPAAPPAGPVHQEPSARRGRGVSRGTAVAMWLCGVAMGFALGAFTPWHGIVAGSLRRAADTLAPASARAPDTAAPPAPAEAAAPTPPPAPVRRGSASAPEKRSRLPHTAVEASGGGSGTGILDVTAPDEAEIWLDGRRIGTGSVRRQIPEGDHRVEVRRGAARVGERFHVDPGETWTYAVTPQ